MDSKAFKGMKYEDVLEKIFTQIAREGAGIGIHLLITAGRQSSMRLNLQSNIKLQLAMKLIDDNEAKNIVGRTQLAIDDLPGRGLVKFDEPALFQAALPTLGEDTLDIIEAIREEAKEMDAYWTGERPEEIPMIPEVLTEEEFLSIPSVKSALQTPNLLPVGLDFEDVQSVLWNSNQSNLLFAYGKAQEGEQFAKRLIKRLKGKNQKILLFDAANSGLYEEYEKVNVHATSKDQYTDLIDAIQEKIADRVSQYEICKNEKQELSPKEFYLTLEPIYVVLNNILKCVANMDSKDITRLAKLIEESRVQGFYYVTINDIFELSKGYDEISKVLKRSEETIIKVRLNDQNFLMVNNKEYKEENLKEDEAYYIVDGYALKIKQER